MAIPFGSSCKLADNRETRMKLDEFATAVAEFVWSVEELFDRDFQYTKSMFHRSMMAAHFLSQISTTAVCFGEERRQTVFPLGNCVPRNHLLSNVVHSGDGCSYIMAE